jgi:ABC-type nitrate/sulfonate/bicarbonate transport system ATPase subunit
MIQFNNICHNYNKRGKELVVQDITFSIAKGECVGLTGPSGCGKSTIANIAAGHIRPVEGKIIVDGNDLTGKPKRRGFLIHQESDLFPWLKVKNQVSFALKIKNESKVDKLLSLVKLSKYQNYYPNELSGGMKKRLAIARALAVNPKLLILDESFGSLDSNLKLELYTELKEIWEKTKTTILLITHDSKDLENLAQREIKLSSQKPTCIQEIIRR